MQNKCQGDTQGARGATWRRCAEPVRSQCEAADAQACPALAFRRAHGARRCSASSAPRSTQMRWRGAALEVFGRHGHRWQRRWQRDIAAPPDPSAANPCAGVASRRVPPRRRGSVGNTTHGTRTRRAVRTQASCGVEWAAAVWERAACCFGGPLLHAAHLAAPRNWQRPCVSFVEFDAVPSRPRQGPPRLAFPITPLWRFLCPAEPDSRTRAGQHAPAACPSSLGPAETVAAAGAACPPAPRGKERDKSQAFLAD